MVVNNFPVVKKILDAWPVREISAINSRHISACKEYEDYSYAAGLHVGEYDQIVIAKGSGQWGKEGGLKFGGSNIDFTPSGIYRHELGHHVWENYAHAYEGLINTPTMKADFIKGYKGLSDKIVDRKISFYASSKLASGQRNVNEGFAESFSAWAHPSYGINNKILPKEIENVMKKYFPKGG